MGLLIPRCLAMQETQVWPQDREDPLEKEMATHSYILALENPWTEKPGGLQSMESRKSQRILSNWTKTTKTRRHIINKLPKVEDKERILKETKRKTTHHMKENPQKTTGGFLKRNFACLDRLRWHSNCWNKNYQGYCTWQSFSPEMRER